MSAWIFECPYSQGIQCCVSTHFAHYPFIAIYGSNFFGDVRYYFTQLTLRQCKLLELFPYQNKKKWWPDGIKLTSQRFLLVIHYSLVRSSKGGHFVESVNSCCEEKQGIKPYHTLMLLFFISFPESSITIVNDCCLFGCRFESYSRIRTAEDALAFFALNFQKNLSNNPAVNDRVI